MIALTVLSVGCALSELYIALALERVFLWREDFAFRQTQDAGAGVMRMFSTSITQTAITIFKDCC